MYATLLSEGILEIHSPRFCETLFFGAVLSMPGMCSFLVSSKLALFIKIKNRHFFSASTTSHQLSECASIQQCCFRFIFNFLILRPAALLPSSPTLINYLITIEH
jgi:hypothetical protein